MLSSRLLRLQLDRAKAENKRLLSIIEECKTHVETAGELIEEAERALASYEDKAAEMVGQQLNATPVRDGNEVPG